MHSGPTVAMNAYRRMVRSRLVQSIDHGFERAIAVVGEARWHEAVDRFFAKSPPTSVYLRDVGGEFLRFFAAEAESGTGRRLDPPYLLDLMRYEWAELDTAYTAEEVRPDDVVALDVNLPAVLSPAHRLLHLGYPVHRIGAEEEGAGDRWRRRPARCSRRRRSISAFTATPARTRCARWRPLTAITATMLALMARRERTLAEVVRAAAERHEATLDAGFVDALSGVLADFSERGLLLGSLAPG